MLTAGRFDAPSGREHSGIGRLADSLGGIRRKAGGEVKGKRLVVRVGVMGRGEKEPDMAGVNRADLRFILARLVFIWLCRNPRVPGSEQLY